MYVDSDQMLWVDFRGGSYPLALVQGYGIGQNKPATFRAEGLNESTYIKLRYDASYGNSITATDFVQANADGTFAYTLPNNGTLQKCIIYMPQGTSPQAPVHDAWEESDAEITGIEKTQAEGTQTYNVYNLSGVLVRPNAPSLQGLPKGIYIVNGKKVIK